jgi:hypothetical protein
VLMKLFIISVYFKYFIVSNSIDWRKHWQYEYLFFIEIGGEE